MKRYSIARVVALVVLLLHSGAFGASAVLDAMVATRANAAVAHVEEKSGATCVAHDEATCQICRVANTSLCCAAQQLTVPALVRAPRPAADTRAEYAAVARTALHSRAPPVA